MENKAHWHYWNEINEDEVKKCRKELGIKGTRDIFRRNL